MSIRPGSSSILARPVAPVISGSSAAACSMAFSCSGFSEGTSRAMAVERANVSWILCMAVRLSEYTSSVTELSLKA